MSILRSLRQALRGLLRTPTFTAMALLTLALGIGANTAVFSVIKAVFLKPLPFARPDELVYIHVDSAKLFPDIPFLRLSGPYYQAIKERQTTFSDLAAYSRQRLDLTGHGDAERLLGMGVTGSFFPVVGVKPLLGRTLLPSDERGAKVVVLSHALWRDRFQGDPGLLGRILTLSGQGYTVVGVMPPSFRWQADPQFFTADGPTPEQLRGQWMTWAFHGLGRLKPGITLGQAQADLSRIHAELVREVPKLAQAPLSATGYRTYLYGGQRSKGLMLGLTGGLVLLIACANLANLMVSRAAHRQHELALRQALGGTWMDGLRPFLAEGVLVALAGGGLGLAFSLGLSQMLKPFVPLELQGVVGVDGRLLLFAFGVALGTTLLCSLAPALLATRVNLVAALRHDTRTTQGRRQGWLRNGLVITQVALSLSLLVGFAALYQSLRKLNQAPMGYRPDQALAFTLRVDGKRTPTWKAATAHVGQVVDGIAALPGVTGVGVASELPMDAGANADYKLPGRESLFLTAYIRSLSPGGVSALGMTLLKGRDFADSDCVEIPDNILVSRSLAARCWPGEDPIGKTLVRQREDGPGALRVVGLVEDVRHAGPRVGQNLDTIYYPGISDENRIVVRSAGSPEALIGGLRAHLRAKEPDLPLASLEPLRQRQDRALEGERTLTRLLGLLAGLALCLASAGIYGVMAYSVAQRTREIGIRKALGGQNGQVIWDISRRGLPLIAFGLGLGALLTLASGQVLASFVYGVSATDPLFIALAALVLGLVALAATLLPASWAARIEPAAALRSE
jgi:predicted permease